MKAMSKLINKIIDKPNMIRNRHPDGNPNKDELKFIGYWNRNTINKKHEHSTWMKAMGHLDSAYEKFTNELPSPWQFVDDNWNKEEQNMVVQYLQQGETWECWLGLSFCRFECSKSNGSRCLTDGTYVWPEGFAHYVESHNVKPPTEFIEHVKKQNTNNDISNKSKARQTLKDQSKD